ncbi:hypothetical protein GS909_15705 [Rhodococcus hoagii]|nr:hypothetical protein [Prescottella equi]
MPFFKYPANPPAVGDPETIDQRTGCGWRRSRSDCSQSARRCTRRRSVSPRGTGRSGSAPRSSRFLVIVTVGYLLLPSVNEGRRLPRNFAVGVPNLVAGGPRRPLWLCLGLTFAFLTERAQQRRATHGPVPTAVYDATTTGTARP